MQIEGAGEVSRRRPNPTIFLEARVADLLLLAFREVLSDLWCSLSHSIFEGFAIGEDSFDRSHAVGEV